MYHVQSITYNVAVIPGDPGVGKTSFVNLLTQKSAKPTWTIGCNAEVVFHQSQQFKSEFVELWDVGGSGVHENSRGVFMQSTYHGMILVHDLTNSKSYINMTRWALEFARNGEKTPRRLQRDAEVALIQSIKLPTLIVGTKQDHLWSRSRYSNDRTDLITNLNAQVISINARDHVQFKDSYQEQQIKNFLDTVIRYKKSASSKFNEPYYNRQNSQSPSKVFKYSSIDLGYNQ